MQFNNATSPSLLRSAILSRQTAAICGQALVVTLPGKPGSIRVCLDAVFPAIPYCIDLIGGPRLEGNPDVDAIWEVPVSGHAEMAAAWRRFAREADERRRKGEFDEVFLTQVYPDNFGKGSDDGRFVVNDQLYITGFSTVLAAAQNVNITVRVNASIVSLTAKDFMAFAIQSTAADN